MSVIKTILSDLFTENGKYSKGAFWATGLGGVGLGTIITPTVYLLHRGTVTAQDWATVMNAQAILFPTVAAAVTGIVFGVSKSVPTIVPDVPDVVPPQG